LQPQPAKVASKGALLAATRSAAFGPKLLASAARRNASFVGHPHGTGR